MLALPCRDALSHGNGVGSSVGVVFWGFGFALRSLFVQSLAHGFQVGSASVALGNLGQGASRRGSEVCGLHGGAATSGVLGLRAASSVVGLLGCSRAHLAVGSEIKFCVEIGDAGIVK